VVEGMVRLVIRASDGREAVLNTGGAGYVYDLHTLFGGLPPMKVERNIVAVDRATIVHLDRATVLRVASRNTTVVMQLMERLFRSAALVTNSAAEYAFMSVRQRLATHLLAAATEEGGRLTVHATQQQLASSVGSVREVVARILRDLRTDGLIAVTRGRVAILDRDRLTTTASM
jgi:CRP/FNR family transcriptional regulator